MAITVRKLATNLEHRSLAALFGMSQSTVGEIALETCEAIANALFKKYVAFLTTAEALVTLSMDLKPNGDFHKQLGQLMAPIFQ